MEEYLTLEMKEPYISGQVWYVVGKFLVEGDDIEYKYEKPFDKKQNGDILWNKKTRDWWKFSRKPTGDEQYIKITNITSNLCSDN
jgi:preprotein translocase subunit Sss1